MRLRLGWHIVLKAGRRLRAKGLLRFEPAPNDARVRHVVVTEQGRAYFTGISELMHRPVGQD